MNDLVERLLRQRYYSGITGAEWYQQAASEVEALEKRIAELEAGQQAKPYKDIRCKHGDLAHKCDFCSLEAEVARLKEEVASLQRSRMASQAFGPIGGGR